MYVCTYVSVCVVWLCPVHLFVRILCMHACPCICHNNSQLHTRQTYTCSHTERGREKERLCAYDISTYVSVCASVLPASLCSASSQSSLITSSLGSELGFTVGLAPLTTHHQLLMVCVRLRVPIRGSSCIHKCMCPTCTHNTYIHACIHTYPWPPALQMHRGIRIIHMCVHKYCKAVHLRTDMYLGRRPLQPQRRPSAWHASIADTYMQTPQSPRDRLSTTEARACQTTSY